MQRHQAFVTGCLLALGASACLDTRTGKISGDRPDGSGEIDGAGTGADSGATSPGRGDAALADSTTAAPADSAVADSDSGQRPDTPEFPFDSTAPPADTAPPQDTAGPDDGVGPPPTLLPPGGPWVRVFIGDCIEIHETLSWTADGAAKWTMFDNNACAGPQPEQTSIGRAIAVDPHVLTLEFENGGWPPATSTWTWTTTPPGPPDMAVLVPPGRHLVTSAFRRVGDARWDRSDRELRGQGNSRSDRRLDVQVILRGYPDVYEMVVEFDVSQRFGGNDRRGDDGTLVFRAKRDVTADGRIAIAAEGYDPDDYPDRYRFQQFLLERYDGYTVDLIAAAFFPVLYESPDDDSLYVEQYDRVWTSASP